LVVTGQTALNQIPNWVRNSSTFTAVVSAGGSTGTGGGANVYVWTLLIVDPNAATDELIHYNSTGAKGSKPTGVKSSGSGSRSSSGSNTSSGSLTATPTFDLSWIDQGKYKIMDFFFSEA
jgi:hypothetical protein